MSSNRRNSVIFMRKILGISILSLLLVFLTAGFCFAEAQKTYTVKQGDNLWDISRRFKLEVKDIKKINGLGSSRLKPGQKLLLASKTPTPKKKSMSKHLDNSKPASYFVKKGDTLYRIAKRFGLSVEELRTINGLGSNRLQIGQSLALASQTPENAEVFGPEVPPHLAQAGAAVEEEAPSTIQRILYAADEMLGTPYRFGGNTLSGIDCSAFVRKAFDIAGITLPRTAREQFGVGEKVERESLKEGDLVFFRTYAAFPSHVGIYIGKNLFVHASRKLGRVVVESLDTPYYSRRFAGAKRPFFETQASLNPISTAISPY